MTATCGHHYWALWTPTSSSSNNNSSNFYCHSWTAPPDRPWCAASAGVGSRRGKECVYHWHRSLSHLHWATINDRLKTNNNALMELAAPRDALRWNIQQQQSFRNGERWWFHAQCIQRANAPHLHHQINHTHAVLLTMSLVLFIRGALVSFFTGATGKGLFSGGAWTFGSVSRSV